MFRRRVLKIAPLVVVLSMVLVTMAPVFAAPAPPTAGAAPEAQSAAIFRGVSSAVKFDVSPPLRDIAPLAPQASKPFEIPERSTGLEGAPGVQTPDGALQTTYGPSLIPAPIVSFDGPGNISGVSPPDPVGDVGPNHYVAMSNLSFAVYSKAGALLYGPALNNTLWAGFGGDCQTDNSGDPIVLYDQFSDRWMLSQFTASGPTYFNCVAVSTTPDPTGTYYRYAFSTGSNFPDYPKYGWWSDALYISTRDFAGGSTYVGVGAYAINRAQLIAGNPAAQVISFLVPRGATPYLVGDGLLPADIDGPTLPPGGSPEYYMGSMDDGGSYGAPQDALTLWKFVADFVTPANSSFTLANTIPISAFDTFFPCTPTSRSCIAQPGTANKLDHLGYRQRPLWRLAYRNFGTHESLVTNQSVEAATNVSGIRWWEVRSPNSSPVLYQDSTYAPGTTDGIQRWMGSIAMDGDGNMALGYSASDGTSTYPSSWYTGRLASDPLNTMSQGEGSIIDGTGSQTGSQRWGDYTAMTVDPVDDCTFWYVNEWVPTTSSAGWQLRIGAFKFNECGQSGGDPNIDVSPLSMASAQAPNTSTQQNLAVGNTGQADLNWNIFEDVTGAPELVDWSDNFDSYATGSQLIGQGGWEGWDNSAAAGALTSSAQALSLPNSADILGATDLVHQYSGYTSGQWVYRAMQFIPETFSGQSYFILLNTYAPFGTNNWSTQLCFDAATGQVNDDVPGTCSGTNTLPLVKGQWVEIRVEIDLDADTQAIYYNNQLLVQDTWTGHVSGGGAANIGAVDLFANNATSVYYDDMSLSEVVANVACDAPSDIPWASVSPDNGTTTPGNSTNVQVTFDSTGLADGIYTGSLCVDSNDPDPGPGNGTDLVIVPLTLTVQTPTAVTLSDLAAGVEQLPAPLGGLPLATLPAAAAAAAAVGAAFVWRRKRD